jgi:hypothetical protein
MHSIVSLDPSGTRPEWRKDRRRAAARQGGERTGVARPLGKAEGRTASRGASGRKDRAKGQASRGRSARRKGERHRAAPRHEFFSVRGQCTLDILNGVAYRSERTGVAPPLGDGNEDAASIDAGHRNWYHLTLCQERRESHQEALYTTS